MGSTRGTAGSVAVPGAVPGHPGARGRGWGAGGGESRSGRGDPGRVLPPAGRARCGERPAEPPPPRSLPEGPARGDAAGAPSTFRGPGLLSAPGLVAPWEPPARGGPGRDPRLAPLRAMPASPLPESCGPAAPQPWYVCGTGPGAAAAGRGGRGVAALGTPPFVLFFLMLLFFHSFPSRLSPRLVAKLSSGRTGRGRQRQCRGQPRSPAARAVPRRGGRQAGGYSNAERSLLAEKPKKSGLSGCAGACLSCSSQSLPGKTRQAGEAACSLLGGQGTIKGDPARP